MNNIDLETKLPLTECLTENNVTESQFDSSASVLRAMVQHQDDMLYCPTWWKA